MSRSARSGNEQEYGHRCIVGDVARLNQHLGYGTPELIMHFTSWPINELFAVAWASVLAAILVKSHRKLIIFIIYIKYLLDLSIPKI